MEILYEQEAGVELTPKALKTSLRSRKGVSYQTEGENMNFLEGMLEISSSERFRI
jgi:hypothetical protein